MALYLFAGIPVSDFGVAVEWYERLFGAPPSSRPHETEAVWELAENRLLYIVQKPEHAGHSINTVIVDDLDDRVARIKDRGLEPVAQETYDNGTRKTTYLDPDGNEIGFGAVPA